MRSEKRQEERPATPRPYPWGSVLIWVFLAFILGLTTAHPTWKSATSIDRSALGVVVGIFYAAFTALVVGAYKYFYRNPSLFLDTRTWTRVTAEEAKRHPLYGVRGWLIFFAFSSLAGFAKALLPINKAAIEAGISLGTLLSVEAPEASFLKWVLWIHGLIVIAILGLLFSKHSSFRPVSIYLLLGFWPAVALAGFLNPFQGLGEGLVLGFIPWAVSCAVWVTYLQKSKRVRVTFEHSVKAGHDKVMGSSPPPSNPMPAVTGEPALDRQFNDASPGTCVQTIPSGASNAMSSTQPTANPITPISIAAEPSQPTIEAQEERLYEQIAQELDTNTVDKGLWTKTYAQSEGDDQQTRVLYIKARFARLLAMEDARRDAIRREQEEAARLAHAHSIRSNLQSRIEKTEAAGNSIELKNLAAGPAGSDFLYNCGLGKYFVGDVKRIFEANPFVLERTTLDGGYTGLHLAVRSTDREMTEYLVEQGANIQARDSQGKTPLDMARETNQPEVVELLERYRAEG